MKQDIKWWLIIAVCILIAGVVLTIWSAQQQDLSMRNDLLIKANIAKTGVSVEHIEVLNGSAADFVTPEYQALKVQLGKIRASDQDIRFSYLMGQRRDGTIIIYADSEPPESENYSPPGEVYSEASTVLKTMFSTREKATEGPLSDHWGTWVSGFIPITDPATGQVIAVFGMDVDAKDWNLALFGACLPSLIATLLIVLLILVSALFQRRSEEEQRRLEISEEKFYRAFHANPALMVVSSIEDGRILDVNASFLATLGYSREEVIGRTTLEMGLYVDPADQNTILRLVKETGQVRNMAVKLYRKDRGLLDGSLSSIAIDVAGVPRLFTATLDQTESRQNETALVRKSEQLVAAYDELTAAGEELKAQFDALTNSERMVRESEERVLTIIHSMQFGIIIIDAETHTILDANQKALDMIGTGNDAVLGTVCHRFICPAEAGRCPVTDLGQKVDSSERVLLTMRGEQVPILKSVIKTVLGGKEVLIESFIDITERKKAEDELKESRERFRQLAEVFPETIFEADTNGYITYANKHGLEQFGYTEEDFLNGINIFNLVSPEDRDNVFLRVQEKVRGTDSDYLEYQALRKDGSTFWVLGLSVPIMLNGITVGLRGFLLDITERKLFESEIRSHEQELMQLSTSLAAANKKLNILSGITRHDINNQLTILMGYLGMLEEIQSDPGLNAYFVTINTAAERIATMVQFTKEYEEIGVNIPAWQDCRTLVDTAAKLARLGQVKVNNDIPAGAEVFADPLIIKVFYNLMDNALRYGGKITTIRFSAFERNGDHVIVCEDDGAGIPAEEKEKIFERGFGKNTGLGLAISREIIDITGITINETGEPGKGVRFEITVPKGSYRSVLPG